MTNYTDLLTRLESADEGSRVLDIDIAHASGKTTRDVNGFIEWCIIWGSFGNSERTNWQPLPKYTRDLTAATSLIDEIFPGWIWNVASTGQAWIMPDESREEQMLRDFVGEDRQQIGNGKTPALALCIALLRALQAKDT